MNITFKYLYRDGANHKNYNEIIFSNPISRNLQEIEKLVQEKLIDGKWFYCKEWNVPDIHFKEFAYDSEIDVDWHEFEAVEETNEKASEQNCIDDFLMLVSMTKLPC
jgi:hypothetical protein